MVYHLVLVFSIAAALLGVISQWATDKTSTTKRMTVGLGILLGLQSLLFIASILPFFDPANLLPPLDRAVTLISIAWIAWLWLFPKPIRTADLATILLSLLALVMMGITLAIWPMGDSIAFLNHIIVNIVWQLLSLAFIAIAIIALLIRKPDGWRNGLAMFILAAGGHLLTIILLDGGDYLGAVRLTQLAMFPILLTLLARSTAAPSVIQKTAEKVPEPVKPAKSIKKEEKIIAAEPTAQEKRRFSTDPKTFHALLALAAETQPEKIGSALTRSIAQTALADLSFLVIPDGEKNLNITNGYDLIREENLGGTTITTTSVPMLANAIQRGKPLRLPASSTSVDLKALGQALGLGNAGHLLSIPLTGSDRKSLGALMLLSPYSNRLWSAEDQSFLANVSNLFVPVLERAQKIAAMQKERDFANDQASQALKKYSDLSEQYEALQTQENLVQQQVEKITALTMAEENARQTIERLQAELESAKKSKPAETHTVTQVEQELRMALEEIAYLQNSLAEANIKILEMDKQPEAPINRDQVEVIASLSQELRQPMSSIVGYTDLLLGESVGILGALQRKFIERIKASTERIGGLIDDLIQITNLEAAHVKIRPEPVDLNLIIDNAVAYTSTQIREKNITLQLNTPETPPDIETDREALQQIIIHLLQNAGAATPAEGTIELHLHLQAQDQKQYLQIEVTDSGGGIAPDDIEKVFQRRYRADHTLIQGVGDTSVGLSIAKSLVDAQRGRIWVDSKPGIGATFSVLLPVQPVAQAQEA